ncbi:hypothetical protein JP0135_05670 [Helicobacter pylori]|uniref:hypothetical protein n=1 Tax=Helicobacter pylori TaxID=210 RepID=UPI000958997B|nr:hypothetical protein [Helicobacter pylori]WRF38211.1 hypothetical protein E5E48_06080 [Helicobacter pylori]WRF42320.1 hypothetical protein E5E47_05885 [Helicobacter pylori]BAW50621.1 uncharacterized protein HPF24_1183 [Helicobacter pylori]BAW66230.1 uncharacterized protein HPF78_1218 [Helicobacter pylori]GHQ27645.1 hypothetical protein JP0061_11300 [Helicobacter pylori]
MVSYSFINLGGGFGISACCHANKLACLAEMIYFGYGIIMDFSALSAAMLWSLSKITWFYIGYAILCVLTLVMGSATCSVIEDYS